jgi:hypothetical protein
MEEFVCLKNHTENGTLLQATFAPHRGMNLMSFKKGGLEILDQSTTPLFMERGAGLGALIGPHFHHRPPQAIKKKQFDSSLFPHIAKQLSQGISEPFTHGIARYVPWNYEYTDTQIHATLKGKDLYKGVYIKDCEGQDFEMVLEAKLVHDGLILHFTIQSEYPSVIGFHYYYAHKSPSYVQAYVKDCYRDKDATLPLPSSWYDSTKHKLHFDLIEEADFGFYPFEHPEQPYCQISLKQSLSILHIEYTSSNEQSTSWQLYHPKEASFVCIEPLSALNPRSPILSASNLQLKLSVF